MDLDDMAILRPHITKIGNRHYRKLAFEGGQFNDASDNVGRFANQVYLFKLQTSPRTDQ